jgi:hypothetical protein
MSRVRMPTPRSGGHGIHTGKSEVVAVCEGNKNINFCTMGGSNTNFSLRALLPNTHTYTYKPISKSRSLRDQFNGGLFRKNPRISAHSADLSLSEGKGSIIPISHPSLGGGRGGDAIPSVKKHGF